MTLQGLEPLTESVNESPCRLSLRDSYEQVAEKIIQSEVSGCPMFGIGVENEYRSWVGHCAELWKLFKATSSESWATASGLLPFLLLIWEGVEQHVTIMHNPSWASLTASQATRPSASLGTSMFCRQALRWCTASCLWDSLTAIRRRPKCATGGS